MTPMNRDASAATGSEHNPDPNSLANDLERSLAASSHLDHFFNFSNDPEPAAGLVNFDHHTNLNLPVNIPNQLPWTIGFGGRWPPPQIMIDHDPQHHHHVEHHGQSWPPPQPWTQMIPHPNLNLQVIPESQGLAGHHQIPPTFSAVWPRESRSSQDQQTNYHHHQPSLPRFVPDIATPPPPHNFPNRSGLPNHDPPHHHLPLVNSMPDSGPSLSGPVLTAGLTQPTIQVSVPPQRDRSGHIAKVSTRVSRRRLRAKSGVEGGEEPIQNYTFVPSNSGDVVSACREEMKCSLFKISLLPTTTEIATMVQSSWEAAVSRQSVELRDWAQHFRRSQEKSLGNIVDSIRKDMRDVVRLFVYFRYNLQTYGMDVSHLINRGVRVLHLTADDSFLDITLTINGRTITVPFGNPDIISYIGYVLYDSRYQYHRYIGSDWTGPSPYGGVSALSVERLRPLFTMTGTLYRWAFEERKTGTVIDSELWVKNNQTYHTTLVERFNNMTGEEKAALQGLVDNIATSPVI